MRRLLFSLGCFSTGVAVCGLGFMVLVGGVPLGGGLILISVYVLMGLLLTAPYVLRPPAERVRGTMWFVPLNWWLVAQLFRSMTWVGLQVLNVVWRLVLQLRSGWSVERQIK